MITYKPELLSPAGDWASLRAALDNGANAVYFGVKHLNMRDNAQSFEYNELSKIANECHGRGARCYLTLNSIIFDDDMTRLRTIMTAAKATAIDAVICWDMAVVAVAREMEVALHLSTQASVSNYDAVKYYAALGVRRIVLARECTLERIADIIKNIQRDALPVTIEAFIHGALCLSMSGRCFVSEYLYGQSANRGKCLQPCRRKYAIRDAEQEGELVIEDGYVLSPKDLCVMPFVDKLLATGIHAFKIEGRMRPPEYVATVTAAYREAIDAYGSGTLTEALKAKLVARLESTYNRGFSAGFYFGVPVNDLTGSAGSVVAKKKVFVADVIKYFKKIGVAEIMMRNGILSVGDDVVVIGKTSGVRTAHLEGLESDHVARQQAVKGEKVGAKITCDVKAGDKIFVMGR